MADYKLLGDNFWEKETKYEGKINLLIKRYMKQNIFKKEEKFYVLGYPAECQEIDNEKKHVKSTLIGIDCEYIFHLKATLIV